MTRPLDKAKSSLEDAWKAARTAAGDVKKEIEKAGIAKSLDEAGREIARAATSVANHLGAELEDLGREIRIKAEAHLPVEPGAPETSNTAPAGPQGAGAAAPPVATAPAPTPAPAESPGARPVGEAYAPEPPAVGTKEPKEPKGPEAGGFRIATDDERRS